MKLSELPEVQPHPWLRLLLARQIDMQLADLQMLLRFPMPEHGLNAGCNLLTGATALNFISGVSVLFYEASIVDFRSQTRRGQRFLALLNEFYPFEEDDPDPGDAGDLLYYAARNPLVHTFGVGKDARDFPGAAEAPQRAVMFEKAALAEGAIGQLLESRSRPAGFPATIRAEPSEWVISVITLTWGVGEMLRRLFNDEGQVTRAEGLARRLMG